MTSSGGDQYIHNQGENTERQHVLHECFRDTTADAMRKSGIVEASFHSDKFKMLEIGCGAGFTTRDLAHQLMNKATITAIDTNANLISEAKARLMLPENKDVQSRITFKVQSGESVANEWKGQFDAVWMRFVVVHVPDPVSLLSAAAACLKPNGILLVEDLNAEGFLSSPPLYGCTLLHEAHIEVSLKLGADVRRGPRIGGYMKQAGMKNIQCNVFVPIFAKGASVQPWCTSNHKQQDDKDRFGLGLQLLRMSLDSITQKILEKKVRTEDDVEQAKRSLENVDTQDYQLFSIPGGQIFQWWGTKLPSKADEDGAEQTRASNDKRLEEIVDMDRHPLDDNSFRQDCKITLYNEGVLAMGGFLKQDAIDSIRQEGIEQEHLAFYTSSGHNVYLKTPNEELPPDHPRNRLVSSSKGCIQTDQIPKDSALHTLYESSRFREFLCAVLGEKELHEYADPLSSINLHYASDGQELNWHYDNSSFAITLLIQKPERGGVFEYVRDVRDADAGDMNYELSGDILDGRVPTKTLEMNPGTLVLFRGRNSMHRVTPVEGDRTRMLVVLAYNTKPDIALSESARMTFFGRLS